MLLTLLLILAVIIIIAVMLQSRGNGLSIVPTSNDFGKFERRGPEATLYNITIALIVAFVALTLLHFFIG